MAFVSEFIGRPVVDLDGKKIGTLQDLVAHRVQDLPHPVVEAIVVKHKHETWVTPYTNVAVLFAPAIPLKQRAGELTPYELSEQDFYLARDVLDKQIIDTEGARVVRVNDLELLRVNDALYVSNVDVGGLGLLRRLGLGKAAQGLATRTHLPLQQKNISWDDIELLQSDQAMRLRVPGSKLSELHPADVAEIISDLDRLESGPILDSLDVEHLADALEEVEPEFQASLVEQMADERVADILEEMEPDEAADLLAELPKERSQGLLDLMEADEAADVRRLLTYPVDAAGGIMTTEYVAVSPNLTVDGAIQALRAAGEEAETIFYVYVTDEDNHLVGVFSLSRLIFAQPDMLIANLMQKRVVTVGLLDSQDSVAQVIAKYDLLAVPVVDKEQRLQGIVTADDALDKIIPTAWKKRLPRFFR
jgi:CBS domain-containing protein/sporulation protein YlmC with PRC-barrel domain